MEYRPQSQSSYVAAKQQLDAIVEQVRAKDVPLEKALDLYEEAIKLGNKCADLIDRADFSLEELEAFNASKDGEEQGQGQDQQPDDQQAADGEEQGEQPAAESGDSEVAEQSGQLEVSVESDESVDDQPVEE